MPSQTMQQMERALAKIPAKPPMEVLGELQGIADRDRRNPAPHLAMAAVAGFSGYSRGDLAPFKKHLARAERLLREGHGDGDVEWEFSENLSKALANESVLVEMSLKPRARLTQRELRAMAKAEIESRRAVTQMGRLLRRLGGSSLPRTMVAALRTLSCAAIRGSNEDRRGMAQLSSIFRGRQVTRDMAGFFLMYGYRKRRSYGQAIRVGRELIRRNPRSPLPHTMTGSAYFFSGNLQEAENHHKRAVALAPNSPFCRISHAILLEARGKLREAKRELQKTQALDRRRLLTSIINGVKVKIEAKERFGP